MTDPHPRQGGNNRPDSSGVRRFDEAIEVSPGYFVQRRSTLGGLASLLLGVSVPSSLLATRIEAADLGNAELSFEQFLVKANPVAEELVKDASRSGQDRYLRAIASIVSKLRGVPMPGKWNNTDQGEAPDSYQIGVNPGGNPFTVLQWRLAPGAVCRPHAHTYGNVVSFGLEGMVQATNYEVVGRPDYESSDSFQVVQTLQQLLGPGDVNIVSLEKNYIHGFVAGPDGARGLDITTRLKPRPEHGTPYLDLGQATSGTFARTFSGSWVYT